MTVLQPDTATFDPARRRRTARIAWTTVGLVLAAAAVGIWIGSAVTTQFHNAILTSQQTRTFSGPVSHVDISVADGAVVVVGGGIGPTRVSTIATSSTRLMPTDDEHLRTGTLTLRSTCLEGPSTFSGLCTRSYVVHVPGKVTVDVSTGTGGIDVVGAGSDVKAQTQNGDVAVERVGSVRATSGTGAVTVDQASGAVAVTAANGPVSVFDAGGPCTVNTGTGPVKITGLAAATAAVTTADGSVALDFTDAPTRVTVSTGTGTVAIAVPAGTGPYKVDASTGTGRVVTSVGSDPTATSAIQANSDNGNVVIGYGPR